MENKTRKHVILGAVGLAILYVVAINLLTVHPNPCGNMEMSPALKAQWDSKRVVCEGNSG